MRNPFLLFGFTLSTVGALLDFGTGYSILTQSYGTMDSMGMSARYDPAGVAWGSALAILGLVLVATVIAYWARPRMGMSAMGKLMAVYGVVMMFIGASMYLGITPMMAGGFLSAFAMLGVGALMIANGALMSRGTM